MTGTDKSAIIFSHVRKVVLDVEKTGRFYCEAFGFTLMGKMESGTSPGALPLSELRPPVRNIVHMYARPELKLELCQYFEPAPVGAQERMPMNTLTMTHMSFQVEDFEGTMAAVRRCGGEVLEQTRVRDAAGQSYIMCLDPDGFRVQVIPMKLMMP